MTKAPSDLPKKNIPRLVLSIILMLAWVFVAIIAAQFIVGYLLIFLIGKENLTLPVWSAVYSALSYALALLIVIFVPWKLFKKWKVTRKSLGLKSLPTWTDVGLAPVGYIVALILSAFLTFIFSSFSWFDAGQAQDVGFSLITNSTDRIIAFITLVAIAPIAEEIIFRGWLYGKLREKTTPVMTNILSIVISSLLTSLLFGLVHFQWNVAIDVFCMSIVLCMLREITGTIYAGILMHMLKNGIAFYLLYVVGMV